MTDAGHPNYFSFYRVNGGRDAFASGESFGWKLYRRQIEFLTIAVVWTQICASHLVGRQSARVRSLNHNAKRLLAKYREAN
jgi:phage FluMu protein gp41